MLPNHISSKVSQDIGDKKNTPVITKSGVVSFSVNPRMAKGTHVDGSTIITKNSLPPQLTHYPWISVAKAIEHSNITLTGTSTQGDKLPKALSFNVWLILRSSKDGSSIFLNSTLTPEQYELPASKLKVGETFDSACDRLIKSLPLDGKINRLIGSHLERGKYGFEKFFVYEVNHDLMDSSPEFTAFEGFSAKAGPFFAHVSNVSKLKVSASPSVVSLMESFVMSDYTLLPLPLQVELLDALCLSVARGTVELASPSDHDLTQDLPGYIASFNGNYDFVCKPVVMRIGSMVLFQLNSKGDPIGNSWNYVSQTNPVSKDVHDRFIDYSFPKAHSKYILMPLVHIPEVVVSK